PAISESRNVVAELNKVVAKVVEHLNGWVAQNRREVRRRRGVNPRMLHDIGVSTHQVRYVVSRRSNFE
ncbi:MAG: hypothetical protein AAF420_14105, partial [Pseudomonadota bacterium]